MGDGEGGENEGEGESLCTFDHVSCCVMPHTVFVVTRLVLWCATPCYCGIMLIDERIRFLCRLTRVSRDTDGISSLALCTQIRPGPRFVYRG